MSLSVQEQMLVEQRVTNDSKSIGIAYLLMVLFGILGIYLFYLGRTISGMLMICATLFGLILTVGGSPIGVLMIGVASLWWIIDLFFIPSFVNTHKQKIREAVSVQLASQQTP
ncbi:TM2 domain protein [compost metagenome]